MFKFLVNSYKLYLRKFSEQTSAAKAKSAVEAPTDHCAFRFGKPTEPDRIFRRRLTWYNLNIILIMYSIKLYLKQDLPVLDLLVFKIFIFQDLILCDRPILTELSGKEKLSED